jgi:hypothetical protein
MDVSRREAAELQGTARLRRWGPLTVALTVSLALVPLGYRLFVDATAAVYYNADERIPEAIQGAWLFGTAWAFLNGAVGYAAYRAGVLRFRRGATRIAAASLLCLDLSFFLLLGLRGGVGDLILSAVVCIVFGLLAFLAWRKPGLGGSILLAVGGLLGWFALVGSATYEGEASGLLFDEDLLAIVVFGLVPFAAGLLFVVSGRYRGR